MTAIPFDPDNDFAPLGNDDFVPPTLTAYGAFLKTNPEYEQTLREIAISCYGQIVRMGLPRNQDCLTVLKNCLLFDQGPHEAEARRKFQSFSGLTEYGIHYTPEELQELDTMAESLIEGISDGSIAKDPRKEKLLEGIFKRLASDTIAKSHLSSQGLGPDTQKELAAFIAKEHLVSLADIISSAAAHAISDPACLKEIESQLNAEDSPQRNSQRIYELYVTAMNGWVAWAIHDDVETMIGHHKDLKRDPALFADALMQGIKKADQGDPGPR